MQADREAAQQHDDLARARTNLDFWEHYLDNLEFIESVGGQQAYDTEYTKRAQTYFSLNMIPMAVPRGELWPARTADPDLSTTDTQEPQ